MRTRLMIVVALSALLALTQTASAQRRGGRGFGGRGMFNNPLLLLQNPDVQKELNLSDEQKDKIKEVAQPVQEKMRSAFQGLRDVPQEERREKMQAAMKEVQAESEKAMASLKDTLKPEQTKRLHQIMLQVRGPDAFSDPHVQEKLKLSDDQKNSIKTILDDTRKDIQEAFQGGGGFQKVQEIRKEANEKLAGVLNDSQKKEWKEMTGKPFTMRFGRGRGRRGGAGGGAGGSGQI